MQDIPGRMFSILEGQSIGHPEEKIVYIYIYIYTRVLFQTVTEI
jgi:hypothetical protein